MFQTKVVYVERGHKRVSLIWPWVASLRSGQNRFFLMDHHVFDFQNLIADSKSFSKHYNEIYFY